MSRTLPCPVAGCIARRHAEHLMCAAHWRRVPRLLQRAVWDGADRLARVRAKCRELVIAMQATSAINDELEEARNAYSAAAAAAITAVEEKERAA